MDDKTTVMDVPPKTTNSVKYNGNKGPKFGARHVQIGLVALGNGVLFSTKYAFSIVIVAMTDTSSSPNDRIPTYDWDNKNVIISSILWSGMVFQTVAGHFGTRYGPKWFIFSSSLLNGISFLLIPSAAQYFGSYGVLACRMIQGACMGTYRPIHISVMGLWAPPEERSRMSCIDTLGVSLSLVVSSTVAGMVSQSALGWPWAVYLFGIVNCVWCLAYFFFGQQSPSSHPKISAEEKKYLQVTLKQSDNDEKSVTPWLKIFTSTSVWAILVGLVGTNFILTMVLSENPIYLDKIMKFDLDMSGLVMGGSILIGSLSGVFIAFLSDYVVKNEVLRIVNSRRLFHLLGQVGCSVTVILATYIPVEKSLLMIVIICVECIFIIVSSVGGCDLSAFDLSPNFAGVIFGVAGTLAEGTGLFAPLLVHWIARDEENIVSWRIVYCITGAISVSSAVFYCIFASDKRKNW
ncbi:putative inorganic phosphate cotransporter [Sitophilus oryzae]|uniref:Inorganic phosphate cotransporter n=1 Tax=Sitophilus oryzae TaxID=7048 RepID=A0A6J2XRL0_SITOR|nr:putative inorganic phosphate cotransporter [Sitophilus oryzae]